MLCKCLIPTLVVMQNKLRYTNLNSNFLVLSDRVLVMFISVATFNLCECVLTPPLVMHGE